MDMQNYTTPFANTGDTEEFSIDTDPSGKVSLEKGWTELYQLRPEEGGLFILRKVFNQMMKLVSTDTVTWKTQSFPNWIDDKGDGTPYAYPKNAIAKYTNGNTYVSLVDNNTQVPTGANWKLFDITSLDNTVKLSGNQTIAGVKTFSSTIAASINGNAATATTCPDFGIGEVKVQTETNLNNYLSGGKFITPATGLSNLPSGWSQARYVIDVSGGSNYASQLLANPNNGDIATRSYNGTVWSNWRTLLASERVAYNLDNSSYITNTLTNGVIIEKGSNANGDYVKFADGTLICKRIAEVTNQAIDAAYGNLFTGFRTWTYPYAFVDIPACSSNIKWGNSSSWSASASINATDSIFYVVDNASRPTGTNTKLNFLAIGKWK